MKSKKQPLLTIGIIFKNEIRCLERCLKALDPLRKAVSCELVMADTGSSDGSREIAACYADILFDFPWIDDFSAARNAVMDRASGKWYLSVDSDEYLDSNITQLVDFLKNPRGRRESVCGIMVRNYDTMEMDGKYSDFIAVRMLRMSTGLRYEGAIHEAWPLVENGYSDVRALSRTILHHDGYVGLDDAQGKTKRDRNLALLRTQLAENPDSLLLLMRYIESGRRESDYIDMIRRAIKGVEKKWLEWQDLGPVILRHAVRAALDKKLPEFEEWAAMAETWFPDSIFTRIDVEYMEFIHDINSGKHIQAVCRGERYLKALKNYRNDANSQGDTVYNVLLLASPYWENGLKIYLADLYIQERKERRAKELLQSIDTAALDEEYTVNMLRALGGLHTFTLQDTTPVLKHFFQGIGRPEPSAARAQKRLAAFQQTAALTFLPQNRQEEKQDANFCRPAYTLFLPLKNQCEIGRGARLMETDDKNEMVQILSEVEDWDCLPIEALSHALMKGVDFPLPQKTLKLEQMENLVVRMASDKENFFSIVFKYEKGDIPQGYQKLVWIRSLLLQAIRIYEWNGEKADGVMLARFFAREEKAFLTRYYAAELLCEDNLAFLPALHRFGWHCFRAVDLLDAGDKTGYVRELRDGLCSCKEMAPIAEYLMEHTPELQKQNVSAELLALAEQVKRILAAYPPGTPEIEALKLSPAYQQVAWLIEDDKIL